MNVQSILQRKGSEVATISSATDVCDAVRVLAERRIGALVVSADGRGIDGIISERDIVGVAASGALDGVTVGDVMSTDVVTCTAGDGIDRLMALMTERRIRHLPVVDDAGQLAGIISIGDVVKARLTELEHENRALSDYISGR